MYLYYRVSRSPSRASAIARRRTRDGGRASLYKIRINHDTLHPKPPIYRSINRTHQHPAIAAPDRDRAAPDARRAISRLYIKYESITYTLSPKTPIYRSINHTPQTRSRSRGARGVADGFRGVGANDTNAARLPRVARSRRGGVARRSSGRGHAHSPRTHARRRALRAPRAYDAILDAKKRRRFVG